MARELVRKRLTELFELWRACDATYLRLVKRWGISLNTVWALEYLSNHPEGVEPAVLADATSMLRQTVSVVLNDLETRGYLRRQFHATDHRKKVICFTDAGKKFCSEVLEAISCAELYAAQALSDAEQKQLVALSRRFCEEFAKVQPDEGKGSN